MRIFIAFFGELVAYLFQASDKVSLVDTVIVDKSPTVGVEALMVKKILPSSPKSHTSIRYHLIID